MRVLVVGANGRVGSSLVRQLADKGYDVVASGRSREKVEYLRGVGAQPIVLDLHSTATGMAAVLASVKPDVVIFTAGSRGTDLLQTDAFGAVKLMQACADCAISRFIMLSSVGSLDPESWDKPGFAELKDYMTAKYFADDYLIARSTLDFTILQPVALTDEKGTGLVQVGTADFDRANSVHDVAAVLAELVESENAIRKIVPMSAGDTPVKQAVAAL